MMVNAIGKKLKRMVKEKQKDSEFPNVTTLLNEEQLSNIIDAGEMKIQQNKELVNIWRETVNMTKWIVPDETWMSDEKKEEQTSEESLVKFWKEVMKLMHRFVKVMVHEEHNIVGAMIVDQMMKMFMLKSDLFFRTKNDAQLKSDDKASNKIKLVQEAC